MRYKHFFVNVYDVAPLGIIALISAVLNRLNYVGCEYTELIHNNSNQLSRLLSNYTFFWFFVSERGNSNRILEHEPFYWKAVVQPVLYYKIWTRKKDWGNQDQNCIVAYPVNKRDKKVVSSCLYPLKVRNQQ